MNDKKGFSFLCNSVFMKSTVQLNELAGLEQQKKLRRKLRINQSDRLIGLVQNEMHRVWDLCRVPDSIIRLHYRFNSMQSSERS